MYDGIILAAAGLERLGLLPLNGSPPAPCQAIIAVESRKGELSEALDSTNDGDAFLSFNTERHILRLLGDDCSKPIGAYSEVRGGRLHILLSSGGGTVSAVRELSEWQALAEGLVKAL